MAGGQENFFALLNLPVSFAISVQELEKQYFAAQRLYHPDRLARKAPAERTQAISESMRINSAYETLKSDSKRARHLLAIHGVQADSIKPSTALLMEIMENREQLAESSTMKALQQVEAANHQSKIETLDSLASAFAKNNIMLAGELTVKLGYILKMEEEIRARKKFF